MLKTNKHNIPIRLYVIAAGLLLLSFYTRAQSSDIDEYSDLVHMLTSGPNEAKQSKPTREKQKVVNFGEYGEEVISSPNNDYDIDISSTLDFLSTSFGEALSVPSNFFYYDHFDYDTTREEITPELSRDEMAQFQLPVPGYLTSQYGYRAIYNRVHRGVDLKLRTGDTVRAALPGRVKALAYNKGGYGYFVIIAHSNGLETLYGHLSGFVAKKGDYVLAGDPIALGGSTGHSTGPHLHFEMRYYGKAFDPNLVYNFNTRTLRYLTKNTVDIIRNNHPPMLMETTADNKKSTPSIPSLTQSQETPAIGAKTSAKATAKKTTKKVKKKK
jgi:murein DD-endopeptidase MepM/ murein hydrolase activator NlpD